MTIKVINYSTGIDDEFVNCWNAWLKHDPISIQVFERKVLLDPNFEDKGLKIAVSGGRIVGFSLCIVRRYPLFYQGLEEKRGWITAIAYDPSIPEAGKALMESSLEYFSEKGRKEVLFSPYTPNYFFPGVDPDRYPWLLKLLEGHGFTKLYEALSMDAQLWPDYTLPAEVEKLEEKLEKEGFEVRPLETKYIRPFLRFLEANFPADWYRHALELLQSGCEKEQVLVAVRNGEVVGYCQYWHSEDFHWHRPGAHFGPFGVREDMRGKGVGTLLLARCLWEMRRRGIHNAFVLWTDEHAARLYSRFGFKVTRRYFIMRRVI